LRKRIFFYVTLKVYRFEGGERGREESFATSSVPGHCFILYHEARISHLES
jgi:hypothetical protein